MRTSGSTSSIAVWSRYPSWPWVIATSASNGSAGTSSPARECWSMQRADLRAVAVREHELVAGALQRGQLARDDGGVRALFGPGAALVSRR